MEMLRATYPYALNKRARKRDSVVPVRKLFFSIPRTKQQSARYRDNKGTVTEFFRNIQNITQNDIKHSFYEVCITIF